MRHLVSLLGAHCLCVRVSVIKAGVSHDPISQIQSSDQRLDSHSVSNLLMKDGFFDMKSHKMTLCFCE